MSVDTPSNDGGDHANRPSCTLCGGPSGGRDGHYLATYATGADLRLGPAERDGLLALCESCTAEVSELTAAWTTVGRPPVASAGSIAEGYAAVADACSFCGDPVDDEPVLGVESWTPATGDGDDRLVEHDNFALCPSCVAIFEEFLAGVRPE